MAYSPADITRFIKNEENDVNNLENRISEHLIARTKETKILGCTWGIPYKMKSDDPILFELIKRFVESGWYVKMGMASAPGPHLEIMEDPRNFNMVCSNIRVYDPTKEDPMENYEKWDNDTKTWKTKDGVDVQ